MVMRRKIFCYHTHATSRKKWPFLQSDGQGWDLIFTHSLQNVHVILLFLHVLYVETLCSSFWIEKSTIFKSFLYT